MSELRFDPIKDIWAIIAPDRLRRGADFISHKHDVSQSEIGCPFCRAGGDTIYSIPNKDGRSEPALRVIPNRYPVLGVEGEVKRLGAGYYDTISGIGAHEIIIDSTRHDLKLGDYTAEELSNLFRAFKVRCTDLTKDFRMRYFCCFKNIGLDAGEMINHPHAQIIATPIIPPKVMAEIESADKHYKTKERCLFCDIIEQEGRDKSRIIFENYDYIAFCPYASSSPFEVSIYPKKHEHSFLGTTDNSIIQLSDIVKEVFARLAILLESPALSFALHSAPPIIDRPDFSGSLKDIKLTYHWHLDIRPIVTRSSGFEWATGISINPLKPEDASLYLKEVALR